MHLIFSKNERGSIKELNIQKQKISTGAMNYVYVSYLERLKDKDPDLFSIELRRTRLSLDYIRRFVKKIQKEPNLQSDKILTEYFGNNQVLDNLITLENIFKKSEIEDYEDANLESYDDYLKLINVEKFSNTIENKSTIDYSKFNNMFMKKIVQLNLTNLYIILF